LVPGEQGRVEDVNKRFVDEEGFKEEGNDDGACL
jgi:hypothetical protein